MKTLFTDKNNLDELVFENRNKAYGAYALRRSYSDTLTRSIYFTLVPLFLLLLIGVSWKSKKVETQLPGGSTGSGQQKKSGGIKEQVTFSEFEIELPQTQEFVIVANKKVREKIIRKDLKKPLLRTAGTSFGISSGETGGLGGKLLGSGGSGPGPISFEVPKPQGPNYVTVSEIMPQYPGGMEALQKYISSNLRYPQWALENGVKGKVVVTFVVLKDGTIDYVDIERGVGFGCDEEAARVGGEMPKWSPGIQNGKKVAVKLLLPIRFDTYQ